VILGSLRTLLKKPPPEEPRQTDEEFRRQQIDMIYKLSLISDQAHWIRQDRRNVRNNFCLLSLIFASLLVSLYCCIYSPLLVLQIFNFVCFILQSAFVLSLVFSIRDNRRLISDRRERLRKVSEELEQYKVSAIKTNIDPSR